MDENFLNFASQVMNDWTDDIKRIADALERISPPPDNVNYEYTWCVGIDQETKEFQGWTVLAPDALSSSLILRRPRQAPAAEYVDMEADNEQMYSALRGVWRLVTSKDGDGGEPVPDIDELVATICGRVFSALWDAEHDDDAAAPDDEDENEQD